MTSNKYSPADFEMRPEAGRMASSIPIVNRRRQSVSLITRPPIKPKRHDAVET
jgi:hypothetical protein